MGSFLQAQKSKTMSFSEYEEKLFQENAQHMIVIEFYKSIIDYFKWDNFSIDKRFHGLPSLVIHKVASNSIEFTFSSMDNTIRMRYGRGMFVIPICDKYQETIQKIINILDYVEIEEIEEKECQNP